MNHKQVLEDDNAPAEALLVVLLQKYGTEALGWEEESISLQIKDDFGIELTDSQHDKLHASIVVLTTDQYENNWQAFEKINHNFNNQPDDFNEYNPLDWDDLIIGLAQAYLIKHEELIFNDAVNRYAGQVFWEFGMSKPPELMPSALMPSHIKIDTATTEKNEALKELFDETTIKVIAYVKGVTP